ncbi:MAG TPA: O-unit flippase [Sulfurimonas sp. UBA10385]|uniref:flippase n=1 Tax=unclassified Sulfurimonas TaxID=2623549 RepID=UPI000A4A2C0C|nr:MULTISPECIES: flippase [unclassified Sulfurimonas]DAB27287.1 MAG TPA: O-unit flippase [Sulfurimonas sp. UBA10385]
MITKLKHLQNHQGFMKYFKNSSWLMGEKILRMVVGLFVGIWVAKYLGPSQFGLFSYAQSFVGLFAAVATFGLDSIVVRELVKDEKSRDELIGTAFWLKLIGAVFVLVLLAFALSFISSDSYTNRLIFIIASATIFQSFNVIDFYFQSKVLSRYIVFANFIALFISTILKIILILTKAPLEAFAWVVLFDSIVLACGFIYFYIKHKNLKIVNWKFEKKRAVFLLRESWPLMIGGMSFVLFSNIDNIMIKEMLSEYYAGIYSAAYKLVTLWYFLPGLILGSLFPAIVSVYKDKNLFYKRVLSLSTLLVWAAISIFVIYVLFSESIIAVTYADKYADSVEILPLLALVNIFIFYNSLWNQWMVVENKTKRTLYFHLLTAIFNIILNYFLIQIYGVKGAVYALLIGLMLTYFIFYMYDRRILKLFLSSLLLEILWRRDEKKY